MNTVAENLEDFPIASHLTVPIAEYLDFRYGRYIGSNVSIMQGPKRSEESCIVLKDTTDIYNYCLGKVVNDKKKELLTWA